MFTNPKRFNNSIASIQLSIVVFKGRLHEDWVEFELLEN